MSHHMVELWCIVWLYTCTCTLKLSSLLGSRWTVLSKHFFFPQFRSIHVFIRSTSHRPASVSQYSITIISRPLYIVQCACFTHYERYELFTETQDVYQKTKYTVFFLAIWVSRHISTPSCIDCCNDWSAGLCLGKEAAQNCMFGLLLWCTC